ncbi:MAG TPA: hypothetical protein VGP07_00075 [Polyangia bacterium]
MLALAGGCGGGTGGGMNVTPPLVTAADVTRLPVGDAMGQARTGSYAVQTGDDPSVGTSSCACRVGTCDALGAIDRWWIVSLVENDGALSLSAIRGGTATLPCAGGINAGGDFWCGKIAASTLARLDGQVTTADGQVTGLTMRSRELVKVSDDGAGHALDCDVQQAATFFFTN